MSFRRTGKVCAVGGKEKTCTSYPVWRLGFLLALATIPIKLVRNDMVVVSWIRLTTFLSLRGADGYQYWPRRGNRKVCL